MSGPDFHPWFLGDLADPWVAEIAHALPRGSILVPCAGDLPETWLASPSPRTLVLHRPTLSRADAARLKSLRDRGRIAPRVVLVLGSYVRQHQWEAWTPLVDAVLPEATASETVGRHLAGVESRQRPSDPRPVVAIVGGDFALRSTLAESCSAAGYPTEVVRDWAKIPPGMPTVWLVPTLDDDWVRTLARVCRSRPVVALLAFADRDNVGLARCAGASACLESPSDPADLAWVLHQIGFGPIAETGHRVPPPPTFARVIRSGVVEWGRPA